MARSLVLFAATILASAGCTDDARSNLPTQPARSTVETAVGLRAATASITMPANPSSICTASVAGLADLDAKLLAAPTDSALIEARAAQFEIASDICD